MGAWVRGRVEGVANYVRMYVCMRGYLRTYVFPARPLLGAQLGANVLDSRKVAGTLELFSYCRQSSLPVTHPAICFQASSSVSLSQGRLLLRLLNPLSRPRAGVAMAVVVNPGLLILYQV